MKNYLDHLLRRIHIRQFVDNMFLLMDIVKNIKSNRKFYKSHRDFTFPPLTLAFDAYNSTSFEYYFNSGKYLSRILSELINKKTASIKDTIKICDWGCGPARIVLHLPLWLKKTDYKLYGTDNNKKAIAWCKKNIKDISFELNNDVPPTLYENEMFDIVYARSVFTHLSEKNQKLWLEELLRILKPNGHLIFTTHGEKFIDHLLNFEKRKFLSGQLVTRGSVKGGKKCFVSYHSKKYMENKLLRNYTITNHLNSYGMQQDIWVLKKV